MEMYSFGLFCLFVMFGDEVDQLVSNVTPVMAYEARRLLLNSKDLSNTQKVDLQRFFDLTLSVNPDYRSTKVAELIRLLDQARQVLF
jgi:hypothetical protein